MRMVFPPRRPTTPVTRRRSHAQRGGREFGEKAGAPRQGGAVQDLVDDAARCAEDLPVGNGKTVEAAARRADTCTVENAGVSADLVKDAHLPEQGVDTPDLRVTARFVAGEPLPVEKEYVHADPGKEKGGRGASGPRTDNGDLAFPVAFRIHDYISGRLSLLPPLGTRRCEYRRGCHICQCPLPRRISRMPGEIETGPRRAVAVPLPSRMDRGYTVRILIVDLMRGAFSEEAMSEELDERCLPGTELAARVLCDIPSSMMRKNALPADSAPMTAAPGP